MLQNVKIIIINDGKHIRSNLKRHPAAQNLRTFELLPHLPINQRISKSANAQIHTKIPKHFTPAQKGAVPGFFTVADSE